MGTRGRQFEGNERRERILQGSEKFLAAGGDERERGRWQKHWRTYRWGEGFAQKGEGEQSPFT